MIELIESPIDATRVLSHVNDPECGAEVLFMGTTRQWTDLPNSGGQGKDGQREVDQREDGQREAFAEPVENPAFPAATDATASRRVETLHLIYESYREMALAQMERLEAEARRRWPVRKIAIVHRLGKVAATEASVAIAVSCPHRSEAFEAAKWLIDELKQNVPIWKQEHYAQHGTEWIHPSSGSCHCPSQPHRQILAAQQAQQQ